MNLNFFNTRKVRFSFYEVALFVCEQRVDICERRKSFLISTRLDKDFWKAHVSDPSFVFMEFMYNLQKPTTLVSFLIQIQ